MSISRLRWRTASALITAGAATAAVVALAVPAGASTGPAQISPEQSGYTTTGGRFATVSASVFLRQPQQYAGQVASLGQSVQLWSSDVVVSFGVTASTSRGGYTTYATIYDRSTHQVIASNPNAQWCDDHEICNPGPATLEPGFNLKLSIRYFPVNRALFLVGTYVDGNGTRFNAAYTFGNTAEPFTQARVGTEFGSSPWDGSYSYTPPAQYTKAAVFSKVRLTSYSGHTASLWSWWVHHKLLANTGQQSGSDWVAAPTDLKSGGTSFQTRFVPLSAQGSKQPVLH
jgi:hypothetical protein